MAINTLSKQEIQWIKEQRLLRMTDSKECLVYPMGAERYLSSVLFKDKKNRYDLRSAIINKNILLLPGYGNNSFLFATAGAQSVTVYDKDPVTIAWLKAFKKYYHFKEQENLPTVGDLLNALNHWYPPLLKLPQGRIKNTLLWVINPQGLRRVYFFYMLSLINMAIQNKIQDAFALKADIEFYSGEIQQIPGDKTFDAAYVPYLLGVVNGIEHETNIVHFIKQLRKFVPQGPLIITPTRNTREFYLLGKRYFTTTPYAELKDIPEWKNFVVQEDRYWFRTQGLIVLNNVVKTKISSRGGPCARPSDQA